MRFSLEEDTIRNIVPLTFLRQLEGLYNQFSAIGA